MKNLKRNVTIAAVLLLVCAAVYLNWSYNNQWGKADSAMVKAEDAAMEAANEAYEAANTSGSSSGYFAEARLNRQVSRDEAMKLLEDAVDSITVAVPAPAEGLSEAAVARITEAVTSETAYTAAQLHVIGVSA